ncbi:hypothetical protein [Aeromicrobium sp. 179-A 4D2 NHS]|uniref:hypothetical protein n=1 Tax=Aeromicrobium sp. 179-A 4D2 NHS TaxID=3142375 RepID=UPI0039A21686
MNAKTVGGALAAVVMVAILIAQFAGKGDTDEPEAAPPAPTGAATLATEAPSAGPTDTPASEAPGSKVSDETRAAQFAAAEAYTVAYFSFSYRDKTPNDFITRVKPFSTTSHYSELREEFDEDDGSLSNAWDDVRKERTVVTTETRGAEYDPWYDATENKAVVVVTYVRSTDNTVGTGGTGDEQTIKVEVSKVGDKFLVSDTIFGDASAGQ